jgi:hypothetical protein
VFLFEVRGTYPTQFRSFAFQKAQATHFKSNSRLTSVGEVRQCLTDRSIFLFVEKRHLPPDLDAEMCGLQGYEALHYVVFSTGISWLQVGNTPPASPADSVIATHSFCTGFPVTRPVPDSRVDLKDAYSFGETELRGFLGEFYAEAGHMIFLSLPPAQKGAEYYRGILPGILQMLG